MSRPTPLPASALPAAAARLPVRFHFSDCDPAGIAFFAAWFVRANEVFEAWFEAMGLDYADIIGKRRTGLGFVHAEADWFLPARHGETLLFTPLVTRVGGASWSTTIHCHLGEREHARLACVNATTDLDAARPVPLPDDLRAALARYAASCESLAP